MIATMVVAMIGAMGWLWLLPWESGVILMTMAERSNDDSDGDGDGGAEC